MHSNIYTIGFTQKTAEEFFRLLEGARVRMVIDVRENRGGQLSGFAKYPDVAFFLDRLLGIAYVHEPRLAPSPEIRTSYRSTRDWDAYEKAYTELMGARGLPAAIGPEGFEGNIALLCSEPTPEKCHRRLAAEMLANAWKRQGHHVTVAHLVLEKAPQTGRKRRGPKGTDSV
ncbi:MAG TPA: DUF488 domain-containing protein [Terriglobia bacterium]|nr:DUF488 domain-containing protein [Terriglobia bacterium]